MSWVNTLLMKLSNHVEKGRGRNWATMTQSLNSITYYVLHNCIPTVQNAISARDQTKLWDKIENRKPMFEAISSVLVCMDQGILL